MSEIEKLVQEQSEAIGEFRRANDARLAQLEKRNYVTEDIEAKLAKIDGALDKLDSLSEEVKKSRNTPSGLLSAEGKSEMEMKNFLDFVRKANYVGSDTAGGFAVPAPLLGDIVNKRNELSDMRSLVSVVQTSTDRYVGPKLNGQLGYNWVGEIASRSETDARTFGQYSIPVAELSIFPYVSQTMLDDGAFDVEGWLMGEIARQASYVEGDVITAGNGIAKPRGFTDYSTVATADATRTDGTLEHIVSGAAGAFASSNPGDVLIGLQESFKGHYQANLTWVTNRAVRAKIRQLKNAVGGYLWQDPDYKAGTPAQLCGNPVFINQSMPALTTDSLSLALGDFKQGYKLVDRIGMRMIRDVYSNKPYVTFYTTVRMGGDVVDFEAIKFIKFGT